jgi:single-strand DNA-binding protein
MASYNRVILVGNLTRDPELKYLPNNVAVCELGLAVNHRWRDRDGNQREEVCFVDVSVFGRAGETVNQYMAKGRQILIEGRLKYDTWTAQDGTKRSKHSVVAENFTFLGSGPREGGGGSEAGARAQPAPRNAEGSGGYAGASQAPPVEAGPTASSGAPVPAPPGPEEIPF